MRLTPLLLVAVAFGSTPVLAGPELTRAYILSIVKDNKPDIEACGRSLHDEVVKTHFVIDTQGSVEHVKVAGKHRRDAVGTCLRRQLSAMRFGPSLTATPVTFPFRLGDKKARQAERLLRSEKGGKRLDANEVHDLLKLLQTNMSSCGSGTVDTHFDILPSGLVRNIEMSGDHADDKVGKCVRTKLVRARFPHAKAATPVTHAFQLD